MLGQEHPATLYSMNSLAFTWKSQGHGNEALALMEICLALQKQKLGLDHPFTKHSLRALNKWRMGNLVLNP